MTSLISPVKQVNEHNIDYAEILRYLILAM